jgi:site-specific DNA-methyltransferase (adenine-specific)
VTYLNTVGIGDSLEYLEQVPDNSIDSVVADAPYGLGKAPDPVVVMLAWARGKDIEVGKGGFMNAKWDAFVPQPSLWREVYRVLKPGGYALVFFGTRTDDWGAMSMRFAGFEILDKIIWHHSTGFPKSLNIAKAIDKRAGVEPIERKPATLGMANNPDWNELKTQLVMPPPTTDDAKTWDGWGTALKPSSEPIVVARKPLAHSSYVPNVLEYGTGAMNIDAGRVGGKRWPANMILSHSPICRQIGTKRVNTGTAVRENLPDSGASQVQENVPVTQRGENATYADADGKETVSVWGCVAGCPVRQLDQQSGVSSSGSPEVKAFTRKKGAGALNEAKGSMGAVGATMTSFGYGDSGTASRFFFQPKAQTKERWAYCKRCKVAFQHSIERFAEHEDHRKDDVISHPTQKPVELMEYLIRLVTQEGGVVLDPFCGSATTAVAAKRLGFRFVTCELDEDYAKIAQARLAQVGVQTRASLQAGSYFCPGCEAKGEIKLISRTAVERMKTSGKKTTCMKCMKRYSYEELTTA